MDSNRLNILVTGADGQLGRSIRIAAANSADNYIFTDVAELDITDRDAVISRVVADSADVIINCAAFTAVDAAEDNQALAERLNVDAVRNLAEAMKLRGGMLIHISTDYVFGGSCVNTPLKESDPVGPTSVYGATKLRGEQAIAESGVNAIVIRTAWLYSEYGKNFLKTMLRLTAERESVSVVFDQVGSPTYAGDLASAIVDIVTRRAYIGHEGVYHYSDEGVCSWFDFATTISRLAGNTKCEVKPCRSDEFPSKVVRPAYSVLDKTKIKQIFGLRVPYWTDSLARCIKNLENEA